jgi:hypothetical protein
MNKRIFNIIGALVLGTLLIGLLPSQIAAANQNWWDIDYEFRRQVTVTTGENSPYNGYAGYTVEMMMDTVSPDIQDDGDDIRIVWWDGTGWKELDRHIIAPDTTSTIIRFRLQADIATSSSDDNYYVYYGNASAGTGPANLDNVYLHYDDFSTDRSGEYNIGRLAVSSWHGSGAYNPPYDSINQRISYDTGDNYVGEWVVADIDERDVYLEIQLSDSGKYPTNTTPGLMARIQWTTPGSNINDFYGASFSQGNYNESGIGRNARNAITSAYDPAGTNYYANNTVYRFYFAVWGINATNFKADFVNDQGQLQWQPEATPYVNSPSVETSDLEASGTVGFLVAQQRGWIDEFMVRRYIEPEPTVVIGAEEPIPVVVITTSDADNIDINSARLNGNLDDLGTAVSVDVSFEWGEIPGGPYPNETTPQTMSATGAFTFNLNNLVPNTTYYFRAKAVGDSTGYGAEKSFTTLTPPIVTTNEATDIEVDSARLNGNLDDLGTAVSVDVSFEWGETPGGPYTNETTPQAMNATCVFSLDLDCLGPNTTYYFRAKAVGDSTIYGAEKSFTTLTPPTVTTNEAIDIEVYSARLNGNLDDLGTAVSVEVSFEWGETPGGPYPNETTRQVMAATGVFNFDLGNLVPNTIYYFRTKAVGDNTVYGAEKSFITLIPPTVTTSDATSVLVDSACLNGNLNDLGTAVLVNASFEWGLTAIGPYTNETTPQVMNTTGAFSFNLDYLVPNTTYYFRTKVVGDSTVYGAEKAFMTPALSTGTLPLVENDTEPIDYFIDITAQGFQKQFHTDVNGRLLETVDITLSDGVLNIRIPERTIISGQDHKRLKALDIDLSEIIPVTSDDTCLLGAVYTILPDRTTFNPSITLTWEYALIDLPEGINEEDLFLAYYNENSGEWTRLYGVIDTVNHTITTEINHPTTLAAFYVKPTLAVLNTNNIVESPVGNTASFNGPAVIQEVTVDPNQSSIVTNPSISNENNWQLVIVIAFGVVALAGIVTNLMIIVKRSKA